MAVVNRPESSVIEDKVVQIARRYPQALYYPFKVVESNLDVNELDADVGRRIPSSRGSNSSLASSSAISKSGSRPSTA